MRTLKLKKSSVWCIFLVLYSFWSTLHDFKVIEKSLNIQVNALFFIPLTEIECTAFIDLVWFLWKEHFMNTYLKNTISLKIFDCWWSWVLIVSLILTVSHHHICLLLRRRMGSSQVSSRVCIHACHSTPMFLAASSMRVYLCMCILAREVISSSPQPHLSGTKALFTAHVSISHTLSHSHTQIHTIP